MQPWRRLEGVRKVTARVGGCGNGVLGKKPNGSYVVFIFLLIHIYSSSFYVCVCCFLLVLLDSSIGVGGCLIAHGAKTDKRNHAGFTLLHSAAVGGHQEMLELLLKKRLAIFYDAKNKFLSECAMRREYRPSIFVSRRIVAAADALEGATYGWRL